MVKVLWERNDVPCKICGTSVKTLWNNVCETCAYRLNKDLAVIDAIVTANKNQHKRPDMNKLHEEIAEAVLARIGKHEHSLRTELIQIAGIAINMVRQIDEGKKL